MSCPCCGKESKVCKISYDIYPSKPQKKIPFPINLYKKPFPTNGIKKEDFACVECIEEASALLKLGRPNFNCGILVTKLENQNPDMIACHIEIIPEKENVVEKIEVPPLVIKSNGTDEGNLVPKKIDDDLSK